MRGIEEASSAILNAARAGRVGDVIRLCRQAQGLTQGELGERCKCNQSTISRIERGTYPPDINTLRNIADQLGIPSVLVGLADRTNANGEAPSIEAPVKRREFLQVAAALASSASLPADSELSLTAIHTITVAQRRLDGFTPSRDLVDSVVAHLRMTRRKHSAAPTSGAQHFIAEALSEIAGFAAWLHWDMHDLGSARSYYTMAIKAAHSTENRTLHAYMLGSLATLAVYEGDATEGLALLRRAATEIEPNPPAIAMAWLSCLEAIAQADANNARRSWEALDRADRAVDQIAVEGPPPWPWVFQFDHQKVTRHRLTCAARLGRPEVAYSVAREIGTFLREGHVKQRALTQLDLAAAYLTDREAEEAFKLAAEAVELGTEPERLAFWLRWFEGEAGFGDEAVE